MNINEPKRVLIVEDEQIVALDLKQRLENMGYEVVGNVAMGEKSFEVAANNKPDLLLMDIKLAGTIDGIQTAELMRKFYNLPVVYLTAFADTATLERAKTTQPFGYIIKPFTDQELQSNIEMALFHHGEVSQSREGDTWLEVLINSIRDAVISVDDEAKIKFMNSNAEQITGYFEEDVVGRPIYEVFSTLLRDNRKPVNNLFSDLRINGREQSLILISKSGREIPINCRAATIKDSIKKIKGVVLVFYTIG